MRTRAVVLLVSCLPLAEAEDQPKLTQKQAQVLVMNVPSVLKVKASGGCPKSELLDTDHCSAFFQIRNMCPKEGSGLIGNYTVDLTNGKIWLDIDKETIVDSARLRKLRRKMLGRSETGEKARRK